MNLLNSMVVTEILEVSLRSHIHGEHYIIRKRPSYGLCFCTSGQITYTLNDKKTISNETCAVIFPKGARYEMYCNKNGHFPLINFQCGDSFVTEEFISIPIKNLNNYLKLYDRLYALFPFKNRQPKYMGIMYEIINMLCEEESSKINPLAGTMKYLENAGSQTKDRFVMRSERMLLAGC